MIRAVMLALLLPGTALACAVEEEFYVTDVARSPVVVLADVVGYGVRQGANTLDLSVTEVWKGEAPAQVTVFWVETMAELPPETWDRPFRIIAGLRPTDRAGEYDLVAPLCGSAHLVEATPANIAAVTSALP